MRWTNSHLHQFRDGERIISDPAFELDEFEGSPAVLDERKVMLMQVAPRERDELLYEYDFGDSWEHRVAVARILDPDAAAAKVARCLDGARLPAGRLWRRLGVTVTGACTCFLWSSLLGIVELQPKGRESNGSAATSKRLVSKLSRMSDAIDLPERVYDKLRKVLKVHRV